MTTNISQIFWIAILPINDARFIIIPNKPLKLDPQGVKAALKNPNAALSRAAVKRLQAMAPRTRGHPDRLGQPQRGKKKPATVFSGPPIHLTSVFFLTRGLTLTQRWVRVRPAKPAVNLKVEGGQKPPGDGDQDSRPFNRLGQANCGQNPAAVFSGSPFSF
jgi:hypothetical protein